MKARPTPYAARSAPCCRGSATNGPYSSSRRSATVRSASTSFRRPIPSVSQRMLTLTLRNLERDGLVSRTVTPSIPQHINYELTDLGTSLEADLRSRHLGHGQCRDDPRGAGPVRRGARRSAGRVSARTAQQSRSPIGRPALRSSGRDLFPHPLEGSVAAGGRWRGQRHRPAG